jgi:hypothetical protein
MSRRWLKRLLLVAAGGGAALALAVASYWPSVSPSLMHAKARIFGPRFVLDTVAPCNACWTEIFAGVSSGDPSWLRIAVDLYPALDGESADTMFEAAPSALEHNPAGAISVLLPRYGPGVVCGHDGIDRDVTIQEAEKRLRIVRGLPQGSAPDDQLANCIRAAEGALRDATADTTRTAQ